MRWLVLEIAVPANDEEAGLLIEALVALSWRSVEEFESLEADARVVVAYFTEGADDRSPPDDHSTDNRTSTPGSSSATDLVCLVPAQLKHALGAKPEVLSYRWQEEAWVEIWRRGLAPRRVIPRIVVSPTWEVPTLTPHEHLVSLDPGMALGTAEPPAVQVELPQHLVAP